MESSLDTLLVNKLPSSLCILLSSDSSGANSDITSEPNLEGKYLYKIHDKKLSAKPFYLKINVYLLFILYNGKVIIFLWIWIV